MADALVSGASVRKDVEVQLLSAAPARSWRRSCADAHAWRQTRLWNAFHTPRWRQTCGIGLRCRLAAQDFLQLFLVHPRAAFDPTLLGFVAQLIVGRAPRAP